MVDTIGIQANDFGEEEAVWSEPYRVLPGVGSGGSLKGKEQILDENQIILTDKPETIFHLASSANDSSNLIIL